MNSSEMIQVLNYLDAEFGTARMTDAERTIRAKHWMSELGQYDYADVMTAVRKLSESGFAPRTGQVRAELQKRTPSGPKTNSKSYFRFWKGNDGQYFFDLSFGSGCESNGVARNPADLMHWRWVIEKTDQARDDYDEVLYAHDHNQDCQRVALNILCQRYGVPCE